MILTNVADDILCCPFCRGRLIKKSIEDNKYLYCHRCTKEYPMAQEAIPLFLLNNKDKQDIQLFWGELYQAVYSSNDKELTRNDFLNSLVELKRLFYHREHLAVREMPINELKGKRILEIGCGAGSHSAFFSWLGGEVISLDITPQRVMATERKLKLLDAGPYFCVQGDAEQLPFADNSFDIVYSNGVLHHTPDTNKTIEEVYRVLKPSGSAVIMLYAKGSLFYWFNLFLVHGIFRGNIFRSKNWLGRVTEWMGSSKQTASNPETKVYWEKEIKKMFQSFKTVTIRKNAFNFEQIPLLGKVIISFLIGKASYNPAGMLLYGHAWRNETKVELGLGRFIGFGLNIFAKK